jgi:hypothetical protein
MTRSTLLASAFLCAAAISSTPAFATPFTLQKLIPIPTTPDNNVGGTFNTYDIGTVDYSTNTYYLADRSNAAIDVYSPSTNTLTQFAGTGHVFTGQVGTNNAVSGPDGATVVNGGGVHQLYAGNGDSTIKVFDLTPGSNYGKLVKTISTVVPPDTAMTDRRVDEMSFAPGKNVVLAANNAADHPFFSLIDTTTGTVTKTVVLNGTGGTPDATAGGIEASDYDSKTGRFYLAIPQFGNSSSDPGGVVAVDPTTGAILATYDFASFGVSSCSPTGVAVGGNGQVAVGCGNGGTQSVILDPSTNTAKLVNGVSGEDEIAYDASANDFLFAARFNTGGPVLGVVDATTGALLQNIPTTQNDHSVAVGPDGNIYVPYGAPNGVCPNGCIAVFGVPEPSSLPIVAVALMGVLGVGFIRRARG